AFGAPRERLGRFSVQRAPARVTEVEITLAGAIAESDPELLARAALAGLLGPVMAEPVNLVNARLVAAERGVEVRVERQQESAGYKRLRTRPILSRTGLQITTGPGVDDL